MKKPILITGATGNVGSELVQRLHQAGETVRAAVISAEDAVRLPLNYVAVVTAIYLTTRFGLAETVTPDTAVLLNRPPSPYSSLLAIMRPFGSK